MRQMPAVTAGKSGNVINRTSRAATLAAEVLKRDSRGHVTRAFQKTMQQSDRHCGKCGMTLLMPMSSAACRGPWRAKCGRQQRASHALHGNLRVISLRVFVAALSQCSSPCTGTVELPRESLTVLAWTGRGLSLAAAKSHAGCGAMRAGRCMWFGLPVSQSVSQLPTRGGPRRKAQRASEPSCERYILALHLCRGCWKTGCRTRHGRR